MYAITSYRLDVAGPLIWLQTCIKKGKTYLQNSVLVKLKQTRRTTISETRDKIFSYRRYSFMGQWIIQANVIDNVLTMKAVTSFCFMGLSFRSLTRAVEVKQDSVRAILCQIN